MSFEFTVETSKGINEVVNRLKDTLMEDKFGVLWDFDLTAKLQEKGMDFNTPYRVLEVCNPQEANRVLNVNKLVGYFLPCKIVVYEENGKTKVGMPKPSLLIGLTENKDLYDIAEEIEERLIISIKKAVRLKKKIIRSKSRRHQIFNGRCLLLFVISTDWK